MNYRGKISKIIGTKIYVEVPMLGINQDFGPCEFSGGNYVVGDRVLVSQIKGAQEDLVISGKIGVTGSSNTNTIAIDTDGVPYYTNGL